MQVSDIVKFGKGDGTILTGRISRVWSNGLYVSIKTIPGNHIYVRSVQTVNGVHVGDSPAVKR